MLSWIPIIGPIIDGIFSIFLKKEDTEVQRIKTEGSVRQTEVTASVQTLTTFKDDIGVRLCRDIVLFPISVYTAVTVWDYLVVVHAPWLVWGTKAIPEGSGLAFLPYAAMVFLFGNLVLNRKQT